MSKSPHSTLTKTCSSCGLPKPLSAFLQLSGTGSSIYGNICSTCRKTNKDKDKDKSKSADEGSSTSHIGYRIDAKAKTESDALKKKLFHEHEEQDQEQRKVTELEKSASQEKKQTILKNALEHRKEMKKGLFDPKEKINATAAQNRILASEDAKKTVDYTKPVLDTQIAGKIKHQSSVFNTLETWLGNRHGSFLKNVEKMGLNKDQGAGKKSAEKTEKPSPSHPSSTRKR